MARKSKGKKLKRDTLALVESPTQLLNVIEWAHHHRAERRTRLIVLPPTDRTTRIQLETVLEYAPDEGLAGVWYDPRASAMSLLAVAWELFPRLAKADRLVIGDPFSRFVQTVLPLADVSQVVVVDDGTATIGFVNQLNRGERLSRWHLRESASDVVIDMLSDHAATFFRPSTEDGRSVELFTSMPVEAPAGTELVANTFAWTRQRFGPPTVVAGADVVGTSLVETGVVAVDRYLSGVRAVTRQLGAGRYFAHRRESDTKLRQIAALTGLKIVRPEVPLEIVVRRGPVSRTMVSYPSTVTHTLPLVLAGTDVRLAVMDVPTAWLATGAPDGAEPFLAGVNRTARDRHGLHVVA